MDLKMTNCPNCGREIPEGSTVCPYCHVTWYSGVTSNVNVNIQSTSGIVSDYFATGTLASISAAQWPDSVFLEAGAKDFRESWPIIPHEYLQKIKEGDEAVKSYNKEIERRERATGIFTLLGMTNLMFQQKKKVKLFRDDKPRVVKEFYTPCESENDFTAKIASLATLFEIDLGPLRKLVAKGRRMRSITLVETWLRDNGVSYDPDMIETWRKIVALRNMEPIHAHTSDDEFLSALSFFGTDLPIEYTDFWDAILHKLQASLKEWQRILEQL